jgi:hypothetical protein
MADKPDIEIPSLFDKIKQKRKNKILEKLQEGVTAITERTLDGQRVDKLNAEFNALFKKNENPQHYKYRLLNDFCDKGDAKTVLILMLLDAYKIENKDPRTDPLVTLAIRANTEIQQYGTPSVKSLNVIIATLPCLQKDEMVNIFSFETLQTLRTILRKKPEKLEAKYLELLQLYEIEPIQEKIEHAIIYLQGKAQDMKQPNKCSVM